MVSIVDNGDWSLLGREEVTATATMMAMRMPGLSPGDEGCT